MKCLAGTSGYSYKEWKGPFYPERLAAKEMLRFYAERLPAVEINNTFYRLPKAAVLESWSEQVPDHFRFALKASRRITHFKRLKDAGDETEYLFRTAQTLGERLGVVLFQFPPNFSNSPERLERLERFLPLIPEGVRATFEFRHASWLDEPVLDLLRARDCAMCVADTEDEADSRLLATASWGYLRLRRPGYTEADLAAWAKKIRSQDWQEVYVFFKHEDAGAGPEMAARFQRLAERAPARRRAPEAAPATRRRA